MSNSVLIYYHGNDWSGIKSRQQYLTTAISKQVPVIYLDGGRDRRGRVTFERVAEDVTVVRGLVALLNALSRRRLGVAGKVVARHFLKSELDRYRNVVFWNAENWSRPFRFIRHDALIYDCMDPPFDDSHEALVRYYARESEVLRRADAVVATAASLREHCARQHARVVLINNACEPSDYSPGLIASAAQPEWWPKTYKPPLMRR